MTWQLVLAFAVVFEVILLAPAQEVWCPPEVQQVIAEKTVERIEAMVGSPQMDKAKALAEMRGMVARLVQKLDGWGEEGVLKRTPAFAKLELPDAKNRYLNAMSRYQVCNWATMNQQSETHDRRSRLSGAIATGAVSLAVVYLRRPFLLQGGEPERIEAVLTGEAMDDVFQQVMKNPALMTHVEQQCQPFVSEVFTFTK